MPRRFINWARSRRLLSACFAALTVLTTDLAWSVTAESDYIIQYTDRPSFPMFYQAGGRVQGAIPDMVAAIFAETGWQVESRPTFGNRSLYDVLENSADVSSIVTGGNLPPLDQYPSGLYSCAHPVVEMDVSVVSTQAKSRQAFTPDNFVLGWLNTTSRSNQDWEPYGLHEFTIVQRLSNYALIKSLLSDRIGGAVMNVKIAQMISDQLESEEQLVAIKPLTRITVHLTMNQTFAARLEGVDVCKTIERLHRDGRFSDILEKHTGHRSLTH